MCLAQEQWIRDHRDKFFAEGKEEGREEERQSARKAMLFRFFSFNYLDEEIPKFFPECSEEELNSLKEEWIAAGMPHGLVTTQKAGTIRALQLLFWTKKTYTASRVRPITSYRKIEKPE